MDDLVALGSEAVEALAANLTLSNARVRRALAIVLGEIGDERALLPLMRYVFDYRSKVEEADGRALAMKSIVSLAMPGNERLFKFVQDVRQDADAFVRAYAMDLLVALADRGGLPLAQDALGDAEEIVRDRAALALSALKSVEREVTTSPMAADELLRLIRTSKGNQQIFFVDELIAREDAFELTSALVLESTARSTVGLRALQRIDDPRVRKTVTELLQRSPSTSEHWAIGLRVLARHLKSDATAAERQLIAKGLADRDRFVHLAALDAAGSCGDDVLMQTVVGALRSPEGPVVQTAAESLARAASPALAHLFPRLDEALSRVRAARINSAEDDWTRAEAFLLRAAARVLSDREAGVERAQQQAFASLRSGAGLKPILITAVELLRQTTPAQGLAEDKRWDVADARCVLALLNHVQAPMRRFGVDLLKLGAPEAMSEMVPVLQQLRLDASIDAATDLVPLLELARCQQAADVLRELARDPQAPVRDAAQDVLRRWRNQAPFIDVDYQVDGES